MYVCICIHVYICICIHVCMYVYNMYIPKAMASDHAGVMSHALAFIIVITTSITIIIYHYSHLSLLLLTYCYYH